MEANDGDPVRQAGNRGRLPRPRTRIVLRVSRLFINSNRVTLYKRVTRFLNGQSSFTIPPTQPPARSQSYPFAESGQPEIVWSD